MNCNNSNFQNAVAILRYQSINIFFNLKHNTMKILFFISSLFYLNTNPVPTSTILNDADIKTEASITVANIVTIWGKKESEEVKIETAENGTTRTTTKIKCDNFFDTEVCYKVSASPVSPGIVKLTFEGYEDVGKLEKFDQVKNIVVLSK